MGKSLITISIPPARILVKTGSIKQLNKFCEKVGDEEGISNTTISHSLWNISRNMFVLLLRTDLDKELGVTLELSTVVHECKHLTNFIMESRGWKLDINNDEPECYLLEEIFKHVYPIWEKL